METIEAPDGDAIELHHLDGAPDSPRVVLLHGLEGSRASHYVGGMLAQARDRNWSATLIVFRGCGSAENNARRFYHSGETTDLELVTSALAAREPAKPLLLTGVSLGGNVLLKWLGEGRAATKPVRAAAAVSVPFDLGAGARNISEGFARIYDWSFLRSLRRKALRKLARYPDLFDPARLSAARNVFEFDEAVTAPVHGFASATDYYSRSSSMGFLPHIPVRTLLLSAENDPFLPANVLERVRRIAAANDRLLIEFVSGGGHVGFVGGPVPWRPRYYAEERVFRFFDSAMERAGPPGYD